MSNGNVEVKIYGKILESKSTILVSDWKLWENEDHLGPIVHIV